MEVDRMRRAYMVVAVIIGILAMAGSGTFATTTMWLSTSAAGTPVAGNSITVEPGASVTLYAFIDSTDMGNTFELMVGYDKSNAATYGAGTAANAVTGNLTLGCTQADILASMPASFNEFALLGHPNAGVVLNASGREAFNASLGGRPFGFLARAATSTNAVAERIKCFSLTLQNNMTAGQSQYVVLSNSAGAKSYSAAWKYGTSLSESSYALNVVSGSLLPTIGTSGKSLRDAIISKVALDYNWVLWGKVSQRAASSFIINDGSGVSVTVSAPGNTVADGNYVSVRGTLNIETVPPTLTSQQINIIH